jgi:hypothetical protein
MDAKRRKLDVLCDDRGVATQSGSGTAVPKSGRLLIFREGKSRFRSKNWREVTHGEEKVERYG